MLARVDDPPEPPGCALTAHLPHGFLRGVHDCSGFMRALGLAEFLEDGGGGAEDGAFLWG